MSMFGSQVVPMRQQMLRSPKKKAEIFGGHRVDEEDREAMGVSSESRRRDEKRASGKPMRRHHGKRPAH